MSTDVAERGFAEALLRLREWIDKGDYDTPTAFVDILHNLYHLEESHKLRLGGKSYYSLRDADANGRVVAGIIYARGVTVHKNAETLLITESRPFTLGQSLLGGGDTLGGQGVVLVWEALAKLLKPDKAEKHGRDLLYAGRLAGRPVLDTFDEANMFFVTVKAVS